METLIKTDFFQIITGNIASNDYQTPYRHFTKEVFSLCTNDNIDRSKLVFILNHTTVELTSLQELSVSNEAKKKCTVMPLYS